MQVEAETTWTKTRSRLAARSKQLPPGHPELEQLRREMHGKVLHERVKNYVANWSPIPDELLEKIAGLLLAARTGGVDDD
jgi:hypothetical protein